MDNYVSTYEVRMEMNDKLNNKKKKHLNTNIFIFFQKISMGM